MADNFGEGNVSRKGDPDRIVESKIFNNTAAADKVATVKTVSSTWINPELLDRHEWHRPYPDLTYIKS